MDTEQRLSPRRKWSRLDTRSAILVLLLHLLCILAPFHFSCDAFLIAVLLYVITGHGITISYHRNLSHMSFKLPKLLEYSFAYCALHALQGDPIDWVSNNRYHHKFHEVFFTLYLKHGEPTNVVDLQKQMFYRFLRSTYFLHALALAILLYAKGGLPYLVWGLAVRTVCFYHVTFCINSVCHRWGKRQWRTSDLSKNNWVLGVLMFGEGWHNNHHAFEYSVRLGLQWWQIDMGWWVILFLQALGLATDVKLQSKSHNQRLEMRKDHKACEPMIAIRANS